MYSTLRKTLTVILLAVITLTATTATAGANALQYADKHPRLFFRGEDLPRMREAIKTNPVAKARYKKLIEGTDPEREVEYPIPCESTNYQWTRVAYRMSRNAAWCGLLYQMTGESKYAEWAKRFLLDWAANFDTKVNFQLAGDYTGTEVGASGEGGNTMGFYFSGDVLTLLALAYDCVFEDLAPAERTTIERDLFGRWVAAIEGYDHSRRRPGYAPDFMVGPGQWNGANKCNMGLTAVGFVLNTPRLYERGVDNFKAILARDMLADGFWVEEDRSYSDTCVATLFQIALMARSCGYPTDLFTMTVTHRPTAEYDKAYYEALPSADGPVDTERSLKMYLDAQLDWQYPDLGPGNWGWTPGRGSLQYSRRLIGMYLLGHAIYKDPAYGFILNNVNVNKATAIVGELGPICFPPTLTETAAPRTASRWYPHGKWIVLKSLEGPEYWNSDAMYAFMPYGHERTKGLQPLTLDLYGFGQVLAPRVTLAGLAQNLTKGYQLNEPGWNNVMIDGCNLGTFRGRIDKSTVAYRHFTDKAKVISAAIHVLGERRTELGTPDVERHPEEDRTMSRTLAMTDRYLVDVFRITYDQRPKYKHNFDYVLHGRGELSFEGKYKNIAQGGDVTAVWTNENGVGLRSTVLTSKPRGNTKFDKFTDTHSQYMVATRANFEEWFVVVHEPTRGASRIAKIEAVANQHDAVALAVTTTDGRVDYIALRTKPGKTPYAWKTQAGQTIELTSDYSYKRNRPD